MSDPTPHPNVVSGTEVRRGYGARYLFLFLLGLVIGAVALVMTLRAWDARRDHFPESLMQVQQWHFNRLDDAAKQSRCAATNTLPHLKALQVTANDLEAAFPGNADDARFVEAASKLRRTIDDGLASPPLNCEGVAKLHGDIGAACKACHQDFR